ncbi:MAG TPA: BadF/BadG/BcrA/BcrD ATPase family protein [Anaerolineales bacterium]|nr:BadF/BadG/BcrA/BcrD ATPase family protein [Anaerolineales bacterium]
MRYFLGIDVGSSKTHALIVDETGRCVGFGKSSGGNHQSVGYDGLTNVLTESFAQARKMSRVDIADIAGAGFGVAGYDFLSDRSGHLQAIASLRLSCLVEVVNDGMNGLLAGATRGIGVNVTAGSSNNCRGRGRNGQEGRIVGNGIRFGEFGGALEIVERGLQMVSYAWIKRIPPTRLTKIYAEAVGAKDELDLLEGISNSRYHPYSFMTIEIIKAAQEGDTAALDVLQWAGEELGWLAVSVARQIEMAEDEVEVIQSGSVFEAGELITTPMSEIVLAHCPKAKLIRLEGPPVVGAVILGMEQARFDGYAIRDKMVRTAKEIVR